MKAIKLGSYTVCKDGFCPPMRKSPAIAGVELNGMYPLAYLSKPKCLSEKTFKAVLDGIRLDLPEGFTMEWETK